MSSINRAESPAIWACEPVGRPKGGPGTDAVSRLRITDVLTQPFVNKQLKAKTTNFSQCEMSLDALNLIMLLAYNTAAALSPKV